MTVNKLSVTVTVNKLSVTVTVNKLSVTVTVTESLTYHFVHQVHVYVVGFWYVVCACAWCMCESVYAVHVKCVFCVLHVENWSKYVCVCVCVRVCAFMCFSVLYVEN